MNPHEHSFIQLSNIYSLLYIYNQKEFSKSKEQDFVDRTKMELKTTFVTILNDDN